MNYEEWLDDNYFDSVASIANEYSFDVEYSQVLDDDGNITSERLIDTETGNTVFEREINYFDNEHLEISKDVEYSGAAVESVMEKRMEYDDNNKLISEYDTTYNVDGEITDWREINNTYDTDGNLIVRVENSENHYPTIDIIRYDNEGNKEHEQHINHFSIEEKSYDSDGNLSKESMIHLEYDMEGNIEKVTISDSDEGPCDVANDSANPIEDDPYNDVEDTIDDLENNSDAVDYDDYDDYDPVD